MFGIAAFAEAPFASLARVQTAFSVSVSESAVGTEAFSAQAVLNSFAFETAQGTDTFSAAPFYFCAVSESTVTQDAAPSCSLNALANVSEIVVGQELTTGGLFYTPSISATANASDSTRGLPFVFSNIAETVSILAEPLSNFEFTNAVADSAAGSSLFSNLGFIFGSFSDSATATDVVSTVAVLPASFADSAFVTDIFNGGILSTGAISESATVADNTVLVRAIVISIAETAVAADVISRIPFLGAEILESAQGSESFTNVVVFPVTVTNLATAQSDFGQYMFISVINANSATVAATPFGRAAVGATVQNTAVIALLTRSRTSDSIFAEFADAAAAEGIPGSLFLWGPVNDSQAALWQDEGNVTLEIWSAVITKQDATWQ